MVCFRVREIADYFLISNVLFKKKKNTEKGKD